MAPEFLVTIANSIFDKIKQIINYTPNIILAIVLIIFAYGVAKIARGVTRRALPKVSDNKALNKFLAAVVYIIVLILGLVGALGILNLDEAAFSLLAGVGIVGIALGFAFQDVAANFISGIALVFKKDDPFKVHDIVQLGDIVGEVQEIQLRSSTIETFQGQMVHIPNKDIFNGQIINYSQKKKRRVDIPIGMSYTGDLQKAQKLAIQTIKKHINTVDDNIQVYYEEFADSSINFLLFFWIKYQKESDYLEARSKAVIELKKAFDKNSINIPFPQRTLTFDQPLQVKRK